MLTDEQLRQMASGDLPVNTARSFYVEMARELLESRERIRRGVDVAWHAGYACGVVYAQSRCADIAAKHFSCEGIAQKIADEIRSGVGNEGER